MYGPCGITHESERDIFNTTNVQEIRGLIIGPNLGSVISPGFLHELWPVDIRGHFYEVFRAEDVGD